jgi:hypothetical protein
MTTTTTAKAYKTFETEPVPFRKWDNGAGLDFKMNIPFRVKHASTVFGSVTNSAENIQIGYRSRS